MYDRTIALECAKASKLAYGDSGHEIFISNGESQATITMGREIAILAFRGTEANKIEDWASDLDVAKAHFKGHKVHRGFLRAYRDIRKLVFGELSKAIGKDIYVTGHSLGAALATLAAYDLDSAGINVAGVYTFGSPRVGDGSFASAYNLRFEGRSYRLINDSDIVCRVPSSLRFRHVNQPIFFDNKGAFMMLAPSFFTGLADVWHNITRFKWGDRFTDHSCDDYIKLLIADE